MTGIHEIEDEDDYAELLSEFSEVSTTHGLYYIFNKKYDKYSRLFWICTTLAVVALGAYWISSVFTRWQGKPILTTIASNAYPIRDIKYPGISICSLGMNTFSLNDILKFRGAKFLKDARGVSDIAYNKSTTIKELLGTFYDDFVETNIPGLDPAVAIPEIIGLLASANPDTLIRAWSSEDAYLDRLSDVKTLGECVNLTVVDTKGEDYDGPTACSPGFHHERGYDICYKFVAYSTYSDQCTNCDNCDGDQGQEMFYIHSNAQLQALGEAIEKRQVFGINPMSYFWTSIKRNPDDSTFTFAGQKVRPSNPKSELPLLDIITTNIRNVDYECFAIRYNDKKKKFEGRAANCEVDFLASICMEASNTCRLKFSQDLFQASLLEKAFVKEKSEGLGRTLLKLRRLYRAVFEKIDMSNSHDLLFDLLWHAQLPCFKTDTADGDDEKSTLVKQCFWKGRRVPCAAIFDVFPTDRGMCCSFNVARADEIFATGAYANEISKLQKDDKSRSANSNKKPLWYRVDNEPRPQSGANKGLTLLLDAHTNLVTQRTVREDFQGIIATVGNRASFPLTAQDGIILRTGEDNRVTISAQKYTADEGVRGTPPERRGCYFGDERNLSLYKEYSQENCMIECRLDFAISRSNKSCIPWFLPNPDAEGKLPICGPWDAFKFMEFFQNDIICAECLPDCNTVTYNTRLTSAPFRRCDNRNLGVSYLCDFGNDNLPNPPIYGTQAHLQFKSLGLEVPILLESSNRELYPEGERNAEMAFTKDINDTYEAYKQDIALVSFFFDKPTIIHYDKDIRSTWIDFTSQIGGLLGLCLGLSLCSVVEVIYWLVFKFFTRKKSGKLLPIGTLEGVAEETIKQEQKQLGGLVTTFQSTRKWSADTVDHSSGSPNGEDQEGTERKQSAY